MPRYIQCTENEVPEDVRFHVSGRNQGQMIEVAYGTFGRSEAGPGDPYKRVHDRSIGPNAVTYYRRVP